jgi:hypothetical protein
MAKFVEQTRNMVLKLRPSSTRVVGKFGLGYALSKMCLNGIGFLESPDLLGKAFSSKRELYIERLYEVIIVGPSAKEIAGEYELTHPGFRVLPLGRTGGSALVLGKEKLDVLTMVNDYKSAWGKHFEELA